MIYGNLVLYSQYLPKSKIVLKKQSFKKIYIKASALYLHVDFFTYLKSKVPFSILYFPLYFHQ